MTNETKVWLLIGFFGQAIFTARFLVQWVASEQKRESVIPVAFWWFSLAGGMILLMYAIHNVDPVIIFGQSLGVIVYVRNLMLVKAKQKGRAPRARRQKKKKPEIVTHAAVPQPHLVRIPKRTSVKQ